MLTQQEYFENFRTVFANKYRRRFEVTKIKGWVQLRDNHVNTFDKKSVILSERGDDKEEELVYIASAMNEDRDSYLVDLHFFTIGFPMDAVCSHAMLSVGTTGKMIPQELWEKDLREWIFDK